MAELALFIACFFIWPATVFYLQLRHGMLAALALLAPSLVMASVFVLQRSSGPDVSFPACLFGMAAALQIADKSVRGIASGRTPRDAVVSACRAVVFAVGPMLAAYLSSLAVIAALRNLWPSCALAAAFFAAAFAIAVAGSFLSLLFPYTEEFIARANAARERRERPLERLAFAVEPRWAVSIAGSAIILATIAGFGIRDLQLAWRADVASCFAAMAVLFFAGFFFAAVRDWRIALAATLSALFTGVLLFWALARREPVIDLYTTGAMLLVLAAPLGALAYRTRLCLLGGDVLAAALTRGIREEGPAAAALGAVIGLFGLVATAAAGMLSPGLVFAVVSVLAVLLLFPALTTAIHTLLPRYVSIEDALNRR